MIDLTPLDVRKKRGDFKKSLRGYDAAEVDGFLDLVAERMEELVKANLTLEERAQRLGEQVVSLGGRERAVNEALVTAQQLRDEIQGQAQREAEQLRREAQREAEQLRHEAERDAEHMAREAQLEAKALLADAERQLRDRKQALTDVEGHRLRFLEGYRQLLQRQMELVQVEENRSPLEEVTVELDLGGRRNDFAAAAATDVVGASEIEASEIEGPTDDVPEDDAQPAAAPAALDLAIDLGSSAATATAAASAIEAEPETPPVPSRHEIRVELVSDGVDDDGDDGDDAIPVEGLAPSADDFEGEATILPQSGAGSATRN